MQLMLEDLELRYKVLSNAEMLQACGAIEGTIDYAKSLIIKEKEQIIDAYESKVKEHLFAPITSIDKRDGEQYYNQTYNNDKF